MNSIPKRLIHLIPIHTLHTLNNRLIAFTFLRLNPPPVREPLERVPIDRLADRARRREGPVEEVLADVRLCTY